MTYDKDKVDEMTLALLYLVMTQDREGTRAWKGFDWETMNWLHEKGYIGGPKSKAKSVAVSKEGARLGRRVVQEAFINLHFTICNFQFRLVRVRGVFIPFAVLTDRWALE